MKAFLCTELDRAPVMVPAGNFPIQYSGLNLKQVMYDPTLILPTRAKFMNDYYDDIGHFPRGWVTWQFDQTDMAEVKRIIGDNCCVVGNVPASLLAFGTSKEV